MDDIILLAIFIAFVAGFLSFAYKVYKEMKR